MEISKEVLDAAIQYIATSKSNYEFSQVNGLISELQKIKNSEVKQEVVTPTE